MAENPYCKKGLPLLILFREKKGGIRTTESRMLKKKEGKKEKRKKETSRSLFLVFFTYPPFPLIP